MKSVTTALLHIAGVSGVVLLLINLLGFFVFVPVTMVMARLGAKAVYKIDKKLLSKIFGTFLLIVSIRSFVEYLNII